VLAAAGNTIAMAEMARWAREAGVDTGDVLKPGLAKGWLRKAGGMLELTEVGQAALTVAGADEIVLAELSRRGSLFADELELADAADALRALRSRVVAGVKLKLKPRTQRLIELAVAGRALLADPTLVVTRQQNQLTSEDLLSGRWRQIELRRYDVTLPADVRRPAKAHPLRRIMLETRNVFLRMGFDEIVSPHVESAFWCFDALFQPQDHPAREMQDTFYLREPARLPLPADEQLVERVRRTHEDGGTTGSTGWGYRWDPAIAQQSVLRTHTTATTIRSLAGDPQPPRKVFAVGRVFRNETISYKHLPEFTQVDGVIIDAHASFRLLLGTLAAFYRQMGFDRVKFKPAFFPYTEPSAEVFVWFAPRQTWVELGGCGVFRPEVTQPLGCDVPVLAWGLGLERLAMIRYGLNDIRQLYLSDLDELREVPLCR
jgi:phenylalanyl-tRNA synthetase alpha chain